MNLRQIRKKIKSVTNVKKITKAMQLVSAVKMRKTQQQAVEGLPYRISLENVINQIIGGLKKDFSPLLKTHATDDKSDLVVVISSNKGLCGSFNFNIFRFLYKNFDFKKNDFLTLGKKVSLFISKNNGRIIASFDDTPLVNNTTAVFQKILEEFLLGNYQQVILVYNKFISSFRFETVKTIFLPTKLEEINEEKIKKPIRDYLIEPAPEKIINSLLKSFLEEKIRGAILESEASEHSARMLAMKNATDNAEEIVYNLTLMRNRARQEKITYELLDMVTAKESIES
ncbi:MAG: ATP synthase F1 subunit gamma [Patescibacteria group bacterium]|nr:ATP synthase F1 subunit gamma [Patescibacteria group bacterium]